MTALNPLLLTAVTVPCVRCGSTADTVRTDREVLRNDGAVCCEPAVCWYCGADAPVPYVGVGRRVFCCRACAGDWAA